MSDPNRLPLGRVFSLTGYKGSTRVFEGAAVVTPEPVSYYKIRDAWTHCVRFTAPGFDLVDYDAAIELLRKRYPSWDILYPEKVHTVPFEPKRSDKDTDPEVDA